MRLLQVSLRSLLIYSLVVVVISIPVSVVAIREILNEENDETLRLQANQFLKHIKSFEYLEDLDTDLEVLDKLSHNLRVDPWTGPANSGTFKTVMEFDSLESENQPFRQFSTSVDIKGKPYLMTVQLSLVDGDDLIFTIVSVQAVLIVILSGGLLFLNRSLSKKLWKPFYRTLDQLKAYELDKNETLKLEKTSIIEFDDLNNTITLLADRNRKVYLQQKEFIENASHELQTPVAVFQSKLDILMQKENLSETEASAIQELVDTAQRMSRLNKNLLLLSKIDNEQFSEKENIELSGLIKSMTSNLKPFADVAEIEIQSSIEPFTITANKTLLEVLLSNLLNNAIRHSPKESTIHVSLKDGVLVVKNQGAPLKMDSSTLFERFNKESADPASTGLGLAIVRKICSTNGYQIIYSYKENSHQFSVQFN